MPAPRGEPSLNVHLACCARSFPCWSQVQWVKGSLNISDTTVLDFYRDPRVRLLFKANICRMVNRHGSCWLVFRNLNLLGQRCPSPWPVGCALGPQLARWQVGDSRPCTTCATSHQGLPNCAIVPGCHRMQGQCAHWRQVQGRPHNHGLGADQRAQVRQPTPAGSCAGCCTSCAMALWVQLHPTAGCGMQACL